MVIENILDSMNDMKIEKCIDSDPGSECKYKDNFGVNCPFAYINGYSLDCRKPETYSEGVWIMYSEDKRHGTIRETIFNKLKGYLTNK